MDNVTDRKTDRQTDRQYHAKSRAYCQVLFIICQVLSTQYLPYTKQKLIQVFSRGTFFTKNMIVLFFPLSVFILKYVTKAHTID